MEFDLLEAIRRRGVLLAAHRGSSAGNIPYNSAPAYMAALNHGADIIETDVENSLDGELFIMHPDKEHMHVGPKCPRLSTLPAEEIRKLTLANLDLTPTQYPILEFKEMLELLRGRCFINVDKFDENPEPISREIRRMGMQEQVIVKSRYNDRVLDIVEEYGPDLPFLLITDNVEDLEKIRARKVRYIGAELLWDNDTDPLVAKEVLADLKKDNKVLWGNAILYDYKVKLAAEHTDDTAVIGDPKTGWGWFPENGFDIIQTDWIAACHHYLKDAGYRK